MQCRPGPAQRKAPYGHSPAATQGTKPSQNSGGDTQVRAEPKAQTPAAQIRHREAPGISRTHRAMNFWSPSWLRPPGRDGGGEPAFCPHGFQASSCP